jgi:2-polyprenyl-3-methyl-5-hydroxy-6-metoxy-1,4-benzoquinol methylase
MRYINVSDFVDLYIKVRQRGVGYIASKFNPDQRSRTISTFNDTTLEVGHWWVIPAIRERWNKLITGSAELNYRQYLNEKYLIGRKKPVRILSIGCGSAAVEKELVSYEQVQSVLAIDIAFSQIEYARKSFLGSPYQSKLQLAVLDYARQSIDMEFDMVLFNSSLHHFKDISAILQKVQSNLAPGGLLVLNEYVGPDRFQWTADQLNIINESLLLLPKSYRRIFRTGLIKNKVQKPGILRMILNDPSEAPHSSLILPAVHQQFSILEEKPLGGNILMPLLKDISQNFVQSSSETRLLLDALFEKEDEYIRTVRSNFVFGVYARQ